jgi:hypothetical protein
MPPRRTCSPTRRSSGGSAARAAARCTLPGLSRLGPRRLAAAGSGVLGRRSLPLRRSSWPPSRWARSPWPRSWRARPRAGGPSRWGRPDPPGDPRSPRSPSGRPRPGPPRPGLRPGPLRPEPSRPVPPRAGPSRPAPSRPAPSRPGPCVSSAACDWGRAGGAGGVGGPSTSRRWGPDRFLSLGGRTDVTEMPSSSTVASTRTTSPLRAPSYRRAESTMPLGSLAPAARHVHVPSSRSLVSSTSIRWGTAHQPSAPTGVSPQTDWRPAPHDSGDRSAALTSTIDYDRAMTNQPPSGWGGQPPAWQQQPPPPPPQQSDGYQPPGRGSTGTNGLAVASLVCGILWGWGLLAVLAVRSGPRHRARRRRHQASRTGSLSAVLLVAGEEKDRETTNADFGSVTASP